MLSPGHSATGHPGSAQPRHCALGFAGGWGAGGCDVPFGSRANLALSARTKLLEKSASAGPFKPKARTL
jgi:hypothetical protein